MITIELAKKVLETVDIGLCSGLGSPVPGKMCIEAAVCYALGEPHGDEPSCVSPAVRAFKMPLNDSPWSSNAARAKGMRKLAVAQLGSKGAIDETVFCRELAKLTIQRVLPVVLRKAGLTVEADRCEAEGTEESARAAAYAAYSARSAARAADSAADSADADAADEILTISADACLDALKIVTAPGIELLKQLGLE